MMKAKHSVMNCRYSLCDMHHAKMIYYSTHTASQHRFVKGYAKGRIYAAYAKPGDVRENLYTPGSTANADTDMYAAEIRYLFF